MIISFLISYLLGSIPFGKIVTKILTGKDITKTGSQNIGATNVYRSVSKKAGLLVLILDGFKPMLALIITSYFFIEYYQNYKFLYFFTLISMAVWMVTVKITKISSLGALLSIFLLTIYQIVSNYGTLNKGTIFTIMLLIFWKHNKNIIRLIRGKENKINL